MRRYILQLTVIVVVAAVVGAVAPGSAWAQPANDTFATATLIPSLPFSDTVDTTGATTDSDDAEVGNPCDFGGPSQGDGYATVWYKVTAPTDETVLIDTRSSSYPTAGALVTGEPGSFNGRCFIGWTALPVVAGQTYYIVVADLFDNHGGTLNLSVTVVPPPHLQFSVDRIGRFDRRTGAATVTGTVTCTAGASWYSSGSLSQQVRRNATISGDWDTTLDCGGTAQRWSASVQPSSGMFKGGRANLHVYAEVCNPVGCVSESVERTIQLHRWCSSDKICDHRT